MPRAKPYVILESMESFGGTWVTHKYPRVLSNCDLYTFGYRFKRVGERRLPRPEGRSSSTWAK